MTEDTVMQKLKIQITSIIAEIVANKKEIKVKKGLINSLKNAVDKQTNPARLNELRSEIEEAEETISALEMQITVLEKTIYFPIIKKINGIGEEEFLNYKKGKIDSINSEIAIVDEKLNILRGFIKNNDDSMSDLLFNYNEANANEFQEKLQQLMNNKTTLENDVMKLQEERNELEQQLEMISKQSLEEYKELLLKKVPENHRTVVEQEVRNEEDEFYEKFSLDSEEVSEMRDILSSYSAVKATAGKVVVPIHLSNRYKLENSDPSNTFESYYTKEGLFTLNDVISAKKEKCGELLQMLNDFAIDVNEILKIVNSPRGDLTTKNIDERLANILRLNELIPSLNGYNVSSISNWASVFSDASKSFLLFRNKADITNSKEKFIESEKSFYDLVEIKLNNGISEFYSRCHGIFLIINNSVIDIFGNRDFSISWKESIAELYSKAEKVYNELQAALNLLIEDQKVVADALEHFDEKEQDKQTKLKSYEDRIEELSGMNFTTVCSALNNSDYEKRRKAVLEDKQKKAQIKDRYDQLEEIFGDLITPEDVELFNEYINHII